MFSSLSISSIKAPQPFQFNNSWLRHFSKLTCFSTLFLIFAGAMVKSTGSGLAVPDWPLSYGMFFPPMVGGVFYEHGHRMVATVVGFLTLCLTVWIHIKENRRWVRRLAYWALGAVIAQGLLGGITVKFFLPTPISVVHGILAQIFFILTIILAYSQSKERHAREFTRSDSQGRILIFILLWTGVIFVQLILGALMRHTESGLAIPDFPQMGGQWIPLFNQEMFYAINDWRFENNLDPVNQMQVLFHFLHRLGAFAISILFIFLNIMVIRQHKKHKSIISTLLWLDFCVITQIMLGIMTVMSLKSPQITSLHVVTGAAILGLSVLLFLRIAPVSLRTLRHQLKF